MPSTATWFFKAAVIFLILGILMGIHMSITGNHNVIGAHAHTNLLGWVTSALFGAYYALNPAKAAMRLATLHFALYTGSIAVMVPALYFLLLGNEALGPVLGIASFAAFGAVLLFAFIVYSPASAHRAAALQAAE